MSDHSAEKDALRQRCCWFHRWGPAEWVDGVANPVYRNVCRRCNAVRVWRFY